MKKIIVFAILILVIFSLGCLDTHVPPVELGVKDCKDNDNCYLRTIVNDCEPARVVNADFSFTSTWETIGEVRNYCVILETGYNEKGVELPFSLFYIEQKNYSTSYEIAEARIYDFPGSENYHAGDLCYTNNDGTYGTSKILSIDGGGGFDVYSVRLYKEKFNQIPTLDDFKNLTLGNAFEAIENNESFGIGHIPLSEITFFMWDVICIGNEPVTEEELEGYYMWKELFDVGESNFW